jgi:hypothetical protein
MHQFYVTGFPQEAMLAVAGHPAKVGSYWLPRGHVTPEDELQRKIFPDLDKYLETNSHVQPEATLAFKGFTNLLKFLRIVILQDAAVLMNTYPNYHIFQHELFCSSAFKKFQIEVLETIKNLEDQNPTLQNITKLAPEITTAINGIRTDMSRMDATLQAVAKSIQELRIIVATSTSNATSTSTSNTSNGQNTFLVERMQIPPIHEADTLPSSDSPSTFSVTNQIPNGTAPTQTPANNIVPQYKMCRTLKTVQEVWKEYKHGINGHPSIESLDRSYRARWRGSEAERKYYSNRMNIIKFVKDKIKEYTANNRQMDENAAEIAALDYCEQQRKRMQMSLDKYQKHLNSITKSVQ